MSTTVRTTKSRYTVEAVEVPVSGPASIVVRQPSGKARKLTRPDVGRPRFDAAVSNFFAAQNRPGAS